MCHHDVRVRWKAGCSMQETHETSVTTDPVNDSSMTTRYSAADHQEATEVIEMLLLVVRGRYCRKVFNSEDIFLSNR